MRDISFNALLQYDYLTFKNPLEKAGFFMKHSHNHYEVLYFENGDATYVIENREYQLKKHDLIFIRPMTYHYITLKTNAEYTRYNLAFTQDFVGKELLDAIPPHLEVIHCPSKGIIAENFERMKFYNQQFSQEDFTFILSKLLQEILLNLQYSVEDTIRSASSLSPLTVTALDYINENLFTLKSIEDISNALFITESYFFKLFKKELKITPKKYINTKRILYAQKLIQNGEKPTAAYQQCGFDSYVGFYKLYVKTFGYSPSQERVITK